MGRQALGPRSLRKISRATGLTAVWGVADGGYRHQFRTEEGDTYWYDVGTGEWGEGDGLPLEPPPLVLDPVWVSTADQEWLAAFNRASVDAAELRGGEIWRHRRAWVRSVCNRPHRVAEWTVRDEPLDRDR